MFKGVFFFFFKGTQRASPTTVGTHLTQLLLSGQRLARPPGQLTLAKDTQRRGGVKNTPSGSRARVDGPRRGRFTALGYSEAAVPSGQLS